LNLPGVCGLSEARRLPARNHCANPIEVSVPASAIIDVAKLYEGWSDLLKLTIRAPDGSTFHREVEDHGAAVAVLPFDRARRVAILVRQFRAPVLHVGGPDQLLEAPAGMLDEDDPEACARREAEEEVGLRLTTLERVSTVWSCPGVSTERIDLFLAAFSGADRVSEGGGLEEENEDIEVVEMPLDELWRLAERGGIQDLKTLALVQALRLRHPDLFAG
jgi:nudix-type nucleoside diphosphatase (YffH/AdpP family)